jgi:SAM-dependent methyltransferase
MAELPQHDHDAPEPSEWVVRFLSGLEAGARVVDIACGRGRHLRYALEQGHDVTGLDRDVSKLGDLAGRERVRVIEADLERNAPFPLAGETFDAVIVANYLWRPILPDIAACVAPDGILIYETYALGNERFGKPSNPNYLLKPNELAEVFAPMLVIVAFEHGQAMRPYPRVIQRIAACGHGHPWADSEPLDLAEISRKL